MAIKEMLCTSVYIMADSESISDFVKKQYNGKRYYPTLGELARVKYNGYEINISDLIGRIKNERNIGLPLTAIMKKRAAYQKYLENKEQKKQGNGSSMPNITFPELHYPDVKFPEMSGNNGNGNANHHAGKNEGKRRQDVLSNPQHS
jgi:hypothetical protein